MLITRMTAEDLQITLKQSDLVALAGDFEFPAMLESNCNDYAVMFAGERFKFIPPAERLQYLPTPTEC